MSLYARIDKNGRPNVNGDYAYFGSYPQSLLDDKALVEKLTAMAGELPTAESSADFIPFSYYRGTGARGSADNSRDFMWYIDMRLGGECYRGVYFTDFRPSVTTLPSKKDHSYVPNYGYKTNTLYWFKFEPLMWRIINREDELIELISAQTIDAEAYQALYNVLYNGDYRILNAPMVQGGKFALEKGNYLYASDYSRSTLREWLNTDFYKTAFSAAERWVIAKTEIDNSLAATGQKDCVTCPDTEDYVYILSRAEAERLPSSERKIDSTDYARIQGDRAKAGYVSPWWLRSAYGTKGAFVQLCDGSGSLDDGGAPDWVVGVRPVVRIMR